MSDALRDAKIAELTRRVEALEGKPTNGRHPIQPLVKDERGIVRFKKNNIVCYLLDNGGLDLNQIAMLDFSQEDHEQFAQLIGYSLGGFGELSYVSDETYNAAEALLDGE